MKKKTKTPSMPSLSLLTEGAIEAARASGKILSRTFGKKLQISEKKDAGLVTQADIDSQNRSVSLLKKVSPQFGFLTEEAKPEGIEKPGRWIIDPLDGTTNFVHGFPMFCVSIAAEWKGELIVGVIYHPILDELYVATRGKGATLNGKKIHVSRTKKSKNALLTTGFTCQKREWLRTEMHAFERLSEATRAIRRSGSAALDLAYTARGVFDGFWERRLSPWDVAAGALIVIEAGGQVTDFNRNAFRIDSGELLASNGLIHLELIKMISLL